MYVGRSSEERSLANEERGRSAQHRPKNRAVTLRLDREEDDDGSFYVAFVITNPKKPSDFTTFGSRKAAYAEKLARDYCASKGYRVTKVIRTDSASETSGDFVGLTRRGAGIAAAAGAGLGLLLSSGYLASVEKRAFDRGYLDAQEGQEFAPSMMGEQFFDSAGETFFDSAGVGDDSLLPDWLTYLGIGAGTASLATFAAQLAQTPWAMKRVKNAYARGYEKGSPT